MTIFLFYYICTFGFSGSSGGWGATSEAFIFSLNNYERLAPFVSKVKPEYTGKAISRISFYGPCFGNDVVIPNNADSNRFVTSLLGQYYSAPPAIQDPRTVLAGRWRSLSTDEVEVFYLDPSS